MTKKYLLNKLTKKEDLNFYESLANPSRSGEGRENMNGKDYSILSITGFLILAAIVGFFMWVVPNYRVWSAAKAGEATLSQADYDRQTKVVEAKANEEAQVYNAQAEVARARGVAQANNIIKDSITEMYIRYLWVNTLDKTNNQIIYVPEGADGLPITEAGRTVPAPSK